MERFDPADALVYHLPGLWTMADYMPHRGWRICVQTSDQLRAQQRYSLRHKDNDGAVTLIRPDGTTDATFVTWGQRRRMAGLKV